MSLKEYKEINNDGFVVDSHVLDDAIEKIPKNYKESWGYDKSFYTPKWNFTKESWEEFASRNELLKDSKDVKKAELSQACQECILAGFKAKVNGTDYRFSYDKEAQSNLYERWQLFQNNMIDSITITAHATTDDSFKRINVDFKQFATIYLASVKHKEDCISRLHDILVPMVDNAVTIEQINDIHWDNQVVIPIEPSIVVKDDATLDKQLQETQAKSKQMSQTIDLNGMAMMELMNIVFTGGLGG